MSFNKLYIFIEGNDDERFFKKVIVPLFYKKYKEVELLKYAQWKKEKVNLFLQSIQTLGFDYIFTADRDELSGVNQKKKRIRNLYPIVRSDDIAIVIFEIESWYYAGITDYIAEDFGLERIENTDDLTKEDFNQLYQKRFRSRLDFMNELLKNYSIQTAVEKNNSFYYFIEKYLSDNIENQ